VNPVLLEVNSGLARLADSVHKSLVQIENGRHGAGAGTIWHPAGLILTNAHVVSRDRLTVSLPDGTRHPARVIAHDRELDLAALSLEGDGLPTIELGDSRALRPGDWVMAFGHPWGVDGAATAGVVIGQADALPDRLPFGRNWLAVGLHYRPGHSGGPLVDSAGRLVGINTVMLGPDVGLAVPVHEVKGFLKRAIPSV
jgi:serine protease Do